MTPAELARIIHAGHCRGARDRGKPWVPWESLTYRERAKLEDDARRLQSAYASGCDAPSRGMR